MISQLKICHHPDAIAPSADDAGELCQRVELFLASSHIPALRRVRVACDGDTVVLHGKVGTFYERQMAVQFASRVAGVIRVIDRLQVRSYSRGRATEPVAPGTLN